MTTIPVIWLSQSFRSSKVHIQRSHVRVCVCVRTHARAHVPMFGDYGYNSFYFYFVSASSLFGLRFVMDWYSCEACYLFMMSPTCRGHPFGHAQITGVERLPIRLWGRLYNYVDKAERVGRRERRDDWLPVSIHCCDEVMKIATFIIKQKRNVSHRNVCVWLYNEGRVLACSHTFKQNTL